MITHIDITPATRTALHTLAAGAAQPPLIAALRAALAAVVTTAVHTPARLLQPRCDLRGSPSPFGLSGF